MSCPSTVVNIISWLWLWLLRTPKCVLKKLMLSGEWAVEIVLCSRLGSLDLYAHLAASARMNAAMNAAYAPAEEERGCCGRASACFFALFHPFLTIPCIQCSMRVSECWDFTRGFVQFHASCDDYRSSTSLRFALCASLASLGVRGAAFHCA